MTHNVFVYGSLLADEVVRKLLHRIPLTEPAVVKGYTRHRIKQRLYPAIIQTSEAHSVEGRVLCDLSQRELVILDDFEDEDYYRDVAEAQLKDGRTVQAALYVWQDAHRHLLYGSWDFEEFRAKHLAKFLGMTEEWETSAGFPQEEEEEGDEDLPRPVS